MVLAEDDAMLVASIRALIAHMDETHQQFTA